MIFSQKNEINPNHIEKIIVSVPHHFVAQTFLYREHQFFFLGTIIVLKYSGKHSGDLSNKMTLLMSFH
jgi:hypothetical protein